MQTLQSKQSPRQISTLPSPSPFSIYLLPPLDQLYLAIMMALFIARFGGPDLGRAAFSEFNARLLLCLAACGGHLQRITQISRTREILCQNGCESAVKWSFLPGPQVQHNPSPPFFPPEPASSTAMLQESQVNRVKIRYAPGQGQIQTKSKKLCIDHPIRQS